MYVLGNWVNVSDSVTLSARGSAADLGSGYIVANACPLGDTLFMNITLQVAEDTHVPEDDATWVIVMEKFMYPNKDAHNAGIRVVMPALFMSETEGIKQGTAVWQGDGIIMFVDDQKVTAKHPFKEGTKWAVVISGQWETGRIPVAELQAE